MKTLITGIALFCGLNAYSQQIFTVYFDFNKHHLNQVSLDRLDSFMLARRADNAIYAYDLTGHCDAIGSDNYNDKLSLLRVAAVKQYLRSKDVSEELIYDEKGFGKRMLLNDNKDEAQRRLNRRVEIRYQEIVKTGPTPVGTLKEQIADSAVKAGTIIVLRNINFVGGMSKILPESTPMLEELLEAMRSNPNLVIRIEGHICCHEDKGDGIDLETGLNNLSHARARAVMNYLLENGIPAANVSYQGFGHANPIYPFPEKTEDEKTANRRVEIKIVRK